MNECRSCGMEVEPLDGACPSCGAVMDAGTQSFPAVMSADSTSGSDVSIQSEPVLVVQKGPEVGERFVLDRPAFTVGRDPGKDIFLNDITVSRNHAEISVHEVAVIIRDQGSLNGTYVNGIRVDEADLRHGDAVQIGRFQMIFLSGGAT